ncbi:MAG: thiamine-phosphate kinase [Methylococcales bacterium]|nr:thiamine-phosphate kinase [Methylococcales bacterium]
MLSEFSLIDKFFKNKTLPNAQTRLGIGDDCALLSIPSGYELAITTDTMVENVHFFPDANPAQLGHKLLAVNLSDLAAMGAKPLAVTLALTLPKVDENWLHEFSTGFLNLAQQHNVDLIGGDTTKGALTLTVQAMGLVPAGKALKRSNAQVGNLIFMSGFLGDAGLGLKIMQGQKFDAENALTRFHQPTPRIATGLALRDVANACIDISDGLVSDLGHILKQSGVGATVELEKLPLSNEVKNYLQQTGDWQMPLISGDDYELCFTVSPQNAHRIPENCTHIGFIDSQAGLRLKKDGQIQTFSAKGYEHFS